MAAKVIIIDEISMIDSAKFDNINWLLKAVRSNSSPFGGLQVILSGDLFQLPPVTSNLIKPYIFRSKAWNELNLKICYLHQPKRQKDMVYLNIIKQIRGNCLKVESINLLKKTADKNFEGVPHTKLHTHNADVDRENLIQLEKLRGEKKEFYMTAVGPDNMVNAMKKSCLAPEILTLKKGATVMFVRNNFERGYVNGTLGKVTGFGRNNEPEVTVFSGRKIEVFPEEWTIRDDKKIICQLTQLPLRLAWSMTVHKSQGMTIDAGEIDLSKSFLEGMGYVALSRIRSLRGLKLIGSNSMSFRVDREISQLDEKLKTESEKNVKNLENTNFLKKWLMKRKFLYHLTS